MRFSHPQSSTIEHRARRAFAAVGLLAIVTGAGCAGGHDSTAPSDELPLDIVYAYAPDRPDVFPGQLRLTSADGKTTRSLLTLTGGLAMPVWSPDGANILFRRGYTPTQQPQLPLWIVRSDGIGPRSLPTGLDRIYGAAWSPDGQWIVYHRATVFDQVDISVMRPDGTDQHAIVTGVPDIAGGPTWSRDGRIAFRRNGAQPGIWTVNADGSGLTRLTAGQFDDRPLWSPDGKQLAFMDFADLSAATARYYIGVVNADGTGRRTLTSPDANSSDGILDWSPAGDRILFTRWLSTVPPAHNAVLSLSLAGGTPVEVLPRQTLAIFNGASWRAGR